MLLVGNNLICFVFQIVKTVSPDALSTFYNLYDGPFETIANALKAPLLNMTCSALNNLNVGGS
jgi:hypothetical protein